MIKFTDEQQAVVDYILEQIDLGKENGGKNVIVSGQGGVGKTEMVTELVVILLNQGYSVAASAMTGKATAVLRQKINKKLWDRGMYYYDKDNKVKPKFPQKNLLVETVQKLTKESKILDITESGETKYSNKWKDPSKFEYDVLIIDELSMVPQYISLWWQRTSAIVIGLGDFCQLPEVTTKESTKEIEGFESDLSIATHGFVSGYGIKVLKNLAECHLTKVLRSDNDIALLSDDLRDFTTTKRKVIDTIKKWAEKSPETISYSTSIEDLETEDDWQIICYTNKMCDEINEALCIGGEYPTMEDKILLYDNIPPIHRFNGDVVTLGDIIEDIRKYNSNPKNMTHKITVVLKWKNKMPSAKSKYSVERGMFTQYIIFKDSLKNAQADRMKALPGIIMACQESETLKEQWVREIEEMQKEIPDPSECFTKIIERFYAIDKNMVNYIMDKAPPLPRMYVVNIGYGYAITTHKSQGSEYKNVCYLLEKFDRPLLYTGVSRAKEKLKIINLTSTK